MSAALPSQVASQYNWALGKDYFGKSYGKLLVRIENGS